MSDALAHIAAWEAAGLIDAETAARLRAHPLDGSTTATAERSRSASEHGGDGGTTVAAIFGPNVSIGEMFGYLGGAFLLAAWAAFVGRVAGGDRADLVVAVGAGIAALVVAGLGRFLRGRGVRERRAAGVAFAVAASSVAACVGSLTVAGQLDPLIGTIVAALAGLAASVAARLVLPSVVTQAAVLTWLTALAASILAWLNATISPPSGVDAPIGPAPTNGPPPMVLLVATAAWWIGWALAIGYLGLLESRRMAIDPTAGRRAALTRFWAGLVAVVGMAIAVAKTIEGPGLEPERVLEPWVGDLAILIVSAILVERAFRREASSFVYAAGVGLIVALTDLNRSYLSDTPEAALLLEGLILLGAGLAADRLRRRISRGGGSAPTPPGSPPLDPPADVPTGDQASAPA